MNLSIFSSSPLVDDLLRQRAVLRAFAVKAVLFITLLVLIDLLIGTFLRSGLDKYFGLKQPADILCVGHSHLVLGLDEQTVEKRTGLRVTKYAVEGVNVADRDAMIRHFLERHSRPPQVVLYAVDIYSLSEDSLSSNSYQLFLPYLDSEVMRHHVLENRGADDHLWIRRLMRSSRFNASTLALAMRGWLGLTANLKNGQLDMNRLIAEIDAGTSRHAQPISSDERSRAQILSTVAYLRSQGISVLLFCTPTVHVVADPHRAGLRDVLRFYEDLAANDHGIVFLNYTPELGLHPELFFDPIHLNADGKRELTARLIADLEENGNETLLHVRSTPWQPTEVDGERN